ncbi:kinase-like domain-containing protein [Rhizophagus diaphanus]|nr:kinase-like domain-containing protein [Rhizophagus diaphanus] [Rhizophagus sp. MUCL 43196]
MDYIKVCKKLKLKIILSAIFSKELRDLIMHNGVCPDCKEINTGLAWCNKCDPGRFLKEGKTSGNPDFDKLIHEAQLETREYVNNTEWIPFERLKDIKPIGEGGFATIYSATWLDGIPLYSFKKRRSEPQIVALKKFKNSKIVIRAFTDEIKVHVKCSYCMVQKLYGITKDPKTDEFFMVIMYASDGNLRDYLRKNFSSLKWEEKLKHLWYIIDTLGNIHNVNYIHKDLHSGNILMYKSNIDDLSGAMISDLGLSQSIYDSNNSTNVCGVLPYIAPEILNGKPYTKASDIYSFGIIMVEMSTGKPPYGNISHSDDLALAIYDGLRPKVIRGTPKCYIELVNKCLDSDPEKRPSCNELLSIISKWNLEFINGKTESEIVKEFSNADAIVSREYSSNEITLHPEAIYTSRHMNFRNLPKSRNSLGVQVENSEFSDPNLIENFIYDAVKEQSQDKIEVESTNE